MEKLTHRPAVLITGILTVIPGVITWYKLEMRGEPFLPWDISQVGDLAGVASKITLQIPASLWFIAGIFLILFVLSFLVRMPAAGLRVRLAAAVITLAAFLGMLFGVFMNSSVLKKFGVQQAFPHAAKCAIFPQLPASPSRAAFAAALALQTGFRKHGKQPAHPRLIGQPLWMPLHTPNRTSVCCLHRLNKAPLCPQRTGSQPRGRHTNRLMVRRIDQKLRRKER